MVTNPARQETDSLLEELEKRIKQEYEQAAKEMQEKADKYFQAFYERDAQKRALAQSGKITTEEFLKWRAGAMSHGRRYDAMVAELSEVAVNADKAAMAMVRGSLPSTFATNANYATYEVERATGIDTSFTLYNKDAVVNLIKNQPNLLPRPSVYVPLDKRWNRQHIVSALTQGILQGEDIRKISSRLQSVTDMDRRAAIRNARTMTTSAENAGKLHSYERAKDMGIDGKNMWVSTHDSRTRDSHIAIDGETVEIGQRFSNGCEYPGDPAGDPEEVYNCRCSIVFVSKYSRMEQDYEPYEKWVEKHEEPGIEINLGKTGEGYTQEQRQQLLDLIKNSPQDVQEFYSKYIDGAKAVVQDTSRGYYMPWDNTAHFQTQRSAAGDGLNEPHQLHFHEYGHNLDYLANKGGAGAFSEAYTTSDGRTFEDIITAEWDKTVSLKTMEHTFNEKVSYFDSEADFVSSCIELYKADHSTSKGLKIYGEMLSEFNGVKDTSEGVFEFYTKHYTELEGKLTLAAKKTGAQELIKEVKWYYGLKERGDISDMFERYSCKVGTGAYPFGAGHGTQYAKREGALAKETFAEMFSAEISNSGSLDAIKKYLPESYNTFHEILKEAVKP